MWGLKMLSSSEKLTLTEACKRYTTSRTQDCLEYLEARGIPREVADTFLLGTCTEPMAGHEHVEGLLSIPYRTPTGIVGCKFRRIDGGTPKYMGVTGQKTGMFNVVDLHTDSDIIAICEGELDTIILSGVVGIPAVGVPGVSTWKAHFPKLFEPYRKVFIFADNDVKEDGSNPGLALAKRVKEDVERAVIIHLPEGCDVTDVFLREGAEWFTSKVEVL